MFLLSRHRFITLFIRSAGLALSSFSSARAEAPITSQSLQVVHVSLDAAKWEIDEDKVEAGGNRSFSVRHTDYAPYITISVLEQKRDDKTKTADIAAKQYVDLLRQRTQFFTQYSCPAELTFKAGAVCLSYALSFDATPPEDQSYTVVSIVAGTLIYRRLTLGKDVKDEQKRAAFKAFESVDVE